MVDGRSRMSTGCLGAKHGSVVYGGEAGPARRRAVGQREVVAMAGNRFRRQRSDIFAAGELISWPRAG